MDCSHVFLYCIWWQCQFCIDSLRLSLPLFPSRCLSALLSFFDLTVSPFHFNSASFVLVFLMDIVPMQLQGSLSQSLTISLSIFIFLYPSPTQISYCEFALATMLVRLSQLDMAPASQWHAERLNPPKLSRKKQPAVHCGCFN